MALVKLKFNPGYVKDTTRYAISGGWWDGDNVRFYLGQPQSIGGWVKASTTQFLGSCRMMHEWGTLSNETVLALGTNLKFYLFYGATYYDVTPIRRTVNPLPSSPTQPFSVTNLSNLMIVTDNSHGCVAGDFVTFSGAVGLANITAAQLNTEFQIVSLVDGNSYRVALPVAANATTTGGGSAIIATYQVNSGLDSGTSGGNGWGAGPWGGQYFGNGANTGWGNAANLTASAGQRIGMWSSMNYGEDLVFNQRDGGIYYWDRSSGFTARGVNLTSLSGGTSVPQKATEVTVSAERHVIAFGSDSVDSPGTQDKALIRFSSQETLNDWLPTPTNTAGDLRLVLGSTFVTHVQTTQEILVWSNTALHSMRYVGAPFVYGISVLSSKANIIGPKAKTVLDDTVYWMSRGSFFRYSGRVEMLNCPLLDFIFSDLNYNQSDKIYASTNSLFGEVMWFIPRAGSEEINRCIIYNPAQNIWYYTSVSRTAWMDRVSNAYPQATAGGYLYYHENGYVDGSTSPSSAIVSYIESAPVEIGEGDDVLFVNNIFPDITFRNSTAVVPQVTMSLKTQDMPGSPYLINTTASGAVQRISTVTVEQFTDRIDVRLRGRALVLRVDCNTAGTVWQLGVPRLDGRKDGARA